MDYDNPAVSKQFSVSPVLLEAVAEDPKYMTGLARKMLLLALSKQHQKLMSDDAPVGQRQAHIELLSKLGDAVPKATAGTTVPFSITFVGAPGGAAQQVHINMPPQAAEATAPTTAAAALPAYTSASDADVVDAVEVAQPATPPAPPAAATPSPSDDPNADWDFS